VLTIVENEVPNPVPVLTSLVPSNTIAGGSGFTLTVNGNDFVSGASVQWNGTVRSTIFVSATQVTAAVLSSDIAAAGTTQVTVVNPAPGGGTSNALTFTIDADTTAPDTNITENPSNPTNSASASFSFTSTETGTSFQCRLDGASFAACTSPQTYGNLLNGIHTFEVRATDAANNTDLTPASYTWTVDTIAPDTNITATPSNPSNSTTASFSFTANETGSTFQCQLDGAGFTTCSSPQNYSNLSSATHTFEVRAIDTVGNVGATPTSYTWTIDAVAPDTSITSNPPNPTNSSSASFGFTSTETGSTFQCQLDGAGFTTCSNPQNYSNLSSATHTFEVRAVDPVGNIDSTPASFTWTVDAVAPETNVTATPSNPSNSSSASFGFTSNEPGSTFQCQLDGTGFASCSSPWNYTNLTNGPHTFEVRAIDASNNTDPTPASYPWTVDTIAPETNITSAPPNPSNSRNASFTFTSTEPGSFQCLLDGGGFVTCTNPQTYAGLAEGSHTFQLRSIDQAGNVDPTPTGYTWTYVPVTLVPVGTTIQTGSPRSGSFASLNADDNNYYEVNSTTSGTRTTSWSALFTGVANNLSNLNVTYRGKNSRNNDQTIAIWRWTTSSWVLLDSRKVGTSETQIVVSPPGTHSDYVSNAGELIVQVNSTGNAPQNFFTSGDLMKIVFDIP
jgi:hypothetical protein